MPRADRYHWVALTLEFILAVTSIAAITSPYWSGR